MRAIATFSQPIRDRFGLLITLDYYPEEDIAKIAGKSAEKLNMNLQPASAAEIAGRARGVPRIGNRLLRRVRDVSDEPTPQQVEETLLELGIDSWGAGVCRQGPASAPVQAVRGWSGWA